MTITTISGREFNQHTGWAKIAARSGPVFITDRGRLAYVFLTFEYYQRLTGGQGSIVDLIGLSPDEAHIEPAYGSSPADGTTWRR